MHEKVMRLGGAVKLQIHQMVRDVTALGSLSVLLLLCAIFLLVDPKVGLVMMIGLAAVETVCVLIKLVFHKRRPDDQRFSTLLEKIDAGSFPSIHTARATVVAFALYAFVQGHAGTLILAFFPVLVGWSRVFLKKHYLVDVLAGYCLGLITGFLLIQMI